MAEISIQDALRAAVQHYTAGRFNDAQTLCRQVLIAQPENAGAMQLLALVLQQVGEHQAAVELMQKAVSIHSQNAELLNTLGSVLLETGQLDTAAAAVQKAIALRPDLAEAHNNLGMVLRRQSQFDQAVASFRRALQLKPSLAQVHVNLGDTFQNLRQFDSALVEYRSAIKLNPTLPAAYNSMAIALLELGQFQASALACREAIRLHPNFAAAYNNLGNALLRTSTLDDAIRAYQKAVELDGGLVQAQINLGMAFKDAGRLDQAFGCWRIAIASNPADTIAHDNLIYYMHYDPACDMGRIHDEHGRWKTRYILPLEGPTPPHANDRLPDRPLRVGYVSGDLRNHPVGRFLLALLENHERNSVESICFSDLHPPGDELTQRLRAAAHRWHEIAGLSDEALASFIREEKIDILVDLALHTYPNRLLVFARRPAPVQVTYLGYCGTTGLDAIDYRLSDPYLDPPGTDDSLYSEKTVRLPQTYWCYSPPIEAPDPGPLPALTAQHITFGSLNAFCKINSDVLATWCRLLKAVPESRLILHAREGSHQQRLRDTLNREGIDPHRVSFVGFLPMSDYLSVYQKIDIALDPFPYNGATTTCDALWMGVPTISLASAAFPMGRAGLSLLSNAGLPEFVARSEDEYVRLATELAQELPRLARMRSTMRQRMQASPLMNARAFSSSIEDVYRQMWRRWVETSDR